ncbi:MAG: sulfite exporter TauE/SafE family protein [Pseudomonadota bacterium]
MTLLGPDSLLFLAFIALFTGFIKAGMPSVGALLSATVALVFPPRDALGITLTYLLIGDTVAVSLYWRLAHWQELKKMIVPVVVGIIAGGFLLSSLDNTSLGLAIGIMVLLLVLMEPLRPQLTRWAFAHPGTARNTSGALAGLATTIGNASGPILSIYFLVLNLDKRAFIGTGSIFFLFVNVAKLPIFINQDIFHVQYMASIAATAPLVFIGAIGGKKFIEWIPQIWFNRVVLFFTAVAAVWLIAGSL